MDINYDTIIKQEFPNSGLNLLQTLPNTDFNITVKSEPITDDVSSLVTIKNEPIYEPTTFTQTLATINSEQLSSQQTIVTVPTTISSSFLREETTTTTTDLLQTPMIPENSFVIYELETPAIEQETLTNQQQIPLEIPQIITPINAVCNTQYKRIPQAATSQNNTPKTSASVSSASPPVLLNAKLRKRNKVILPVNPMDKRTRYNIEATTAVSLNKSDINNPPKTLNVCHSLNVGNKKIINHLIKRKNVQKQTEETVTTNSNTNLPTENSEVLQQLTVKEERLSPSLTTNIEHIGNNSTQTEMNLQNSMPPSENTFKPIVLKHIQQTSAITQIETDWKDSVNAAPPPPPSSEDTFKPIILAQIDQSSTKTKATENLDSLRSHPLNSDSSISTETNKIKLSVPGSNSELRVKCLCSLTADHSVNSENDNVELKTFFNEMFEETRRLSKKQQRKIKLTLLQAISDAEDLMEQGKCCGF